MLTDAGWTESSPNRTLRRVHLLRTVENATGGYASAEEIRELIADRELLNDFDLFDSALKNAYLGAVRQGDREAIEAAESFDDPIFFTMLDPAALRTARQQHLRNCLQWISESIWERVESSLREIDAELTSPNPLVTPEELNDALAALFIGAIRTGNNPSSVRALKARYPNVVAQISRTATKMREPSSFEQESRNSKMAG